MVLPHVHMILCVPIRSRPVFLAKLPEQKLRTEDSRKVTHAVFPAPRIAQLRVKSKSKSKWCGNIHSWNMRRSTGRQNIIWTTFARCNNSSRKRRDMNVAKGKYKA